MQSLSRFGFPSRMSMSIPSHMFPDKSSNSSDEILSGSSLKPRTLPPLHTFRPDGDALKPIPHDPKVYRLNSQEEGWNPDHDNSGLLKDWNSDIDLMQSLPLSLDTRPFPSIEKTRHKPLTPEITRNNRIQAIKEEEELAREASKRKPPPPRVFCACFPFFKTKSKIIPVNDEIPPILNSAILLEPTPTDPVDFQDRRPSGCSALSGNSDPNRDRFYKYWSISDQSAYSDTATVLQELHPQIIAAFGERPKSTSLIKQNPDIKSYQVMEIPLLKPLDVVLGSIEPLTMVELEN